MLRDGQIVVLTPTIALVSNMLKCEIARTYALIIIASIFDTVHHFTFIRYSRQFITLPLFGIQHRSSLTLSHYII